MLVIARRFCGPSESANGGYACGVTAAQLSSAGAIEVTLRSPPPLDTAMEVEHLEGRAVVRHGAQLVAEAMPGELDLAPPDPVSFDEATRAAEHYPWRVGHPYPRCFVCGPDRAHGDGLCIFPGAVAGREIAAAPWIPTADVGDDSGAVAREIVWAALDCPSWYGLSCFHTWEGRPLLGRLTARIHDHPRVGERCTCVGWLLRREGRKIHVGSAVFGEGGQLHALARATWLTVP